MRGARDHRVGRVDAVEGVPIGHPAVAARRRGVSGVDRRDRRVVRRHRATVGGALVVPRAVTAPRPGVVRVGRRGHRVRRPHAADVGGGTRVGLRPVEAGPLAVASIECRDSSGGRRRLDAAGKQSLGGCAFDAPRTRVASVGHVGRAVVVASMLPRRPVAERFGGGRGRPVRRCHPVVAVGGAPFGTGALVAALAGVADAPL